MLVNSLTIFQASGQGGDTPIKMHCIAFVSGRGEETREERRVCGER